MKEFVSSGPSVFISHTARSHSKNKYKINKEIKNNENKVFLLVINKINLPMGQVKILLARFLEIRCNM